MKDLFFKAFFLLLLLSLLMAMTFIYFPGNGIALLGRDTPAMQECNRVTVTQCV